ncbi:hypothetical protein CC86DRAFT_429627 [Ophiobolus disseminans]|uniref:Heterokaryon incompatibility domain-containing protein n=1 Tax=Ophiobolus disseminans TaxID=1469910 RepID=A0A6A6ZIG2_9PLEO|nr:hypothetical protein CC86DRAFT_429627 [Ophiobolus disseminans]
MQEIYQNAHNVRVWLGSELDHVTCEDAVDPMASSWLNKFIGRARLSDYGDMPVVLSFIAQAVYNSRTGTSFDEGNGGFPPSYAPEWSILRKFFLHPWFYRVWTVQEIAMANKAVVIVGDWELDWQALASAVSYLHNTYYRYSLVWKPEGIFKLNLSATSWTSLPIESVSYMCRIRAKAIECPLLLGFLNLGRDRGATQAVDYIFAVINLSAGWCTVNNGCCVELDMMPI